MFHRELVKHWGVLVFVSVDGGFVKKFAVSDNK